MVMDCATNEYEMIDKGTKFRDFEVIVVYSGISKNLMRTDFKNRVDKVRVSELAGLPLSPLD